MTVPYFWALYPEKQGMRLKEQVGNGKISKADLNIALYLGGDALNHCQQPGWGNELWAAGMYKQFFASQNQKF